MGKEHIQLSDHFTYGRTLRFVAPSVVMFIVLTLYHAVDGLFVSNYVGKTAFAGVNLIMPFIAILTTPGFMFGAGGSALVAKTLGEGDRQKADGLFSLFCTATIIFAAAVSVVAFVIMPDVARWLGADEQMLPVCVLYGRVCTIGFIPQMLHFLFESFIVTAERPSLGLKVTVVAGVTNIALDALFVAVFRWGVAGAAAATVISQCVGGFVPLAFFLLPNDSLLHLHRPEFDGRALAKGCVNGSSELMTNLSMSLVDMLFNVQLMKYFGEDGVAAYGVIMYVNMLFIGAFIGYAVGMAPVVGYHYGAKNHAELHNVLKKSLLILSVGGVLMLLAGRLLAQPLASVFVGYDEELLRITAHGFSIFSLSFLFSGLAIFASSFFTALNNGLISAIISFLRTLVFEAATLMILPLWIGRDGIWYAVVVAETMAVILSGVFIVANRKKYGY